MSQQAVAEFFVKINTNAALQQEVNAALEGKEDMAAATTLASVGAKHGYEFTAQEAAQKHQEIIAADGELDEEALENVAGGGRPSPPPIEEKERLERFEERMSAVEKKGKDQNWVRRGGFEEVEARLRSGRRR